MGANQKPRENRRWPGLLLSLLVPGFGLFRAGLPLRGVGWFVGMILLNVIVAASLALSMVPVWLAVICVIISVVVPICMLRDGFRPGRMNGLLWLLFIGLLAMLLAIPSPVLALVRSFKIATGGMEPTLRGSHSPTGADRVVVDRLSYRFAPPQRGDMVVFSTAEIAGLRHFIGSTADSFFVQRIVGMPGETIRIEDGKVFADGKPLGLAEGIPEFVYQNPRAREPVAMKDGEDFVVGADEFFVLGDNTSNSLDSRYWGCVPRSSILGKVTMVYYPFSRMRRLPRD